MEKVAIYVDQEAIYNLEDGTVIGQCPAEDPSQIYEHLLAIEKRYIINMAIIGFNHPLRNAIYTVFPNAMVVVNPLDVQQMIASFLGEDQVIRSAQEEIAATLVGDFTSYPATGCQGIYDYQTKEAAMDYYKQWQADVPLGIKSFHHVIRTIDYYCEEIFNYFDIQSILSRTHYKIRQR